MATATPAAAGAAATLEKGKEGGAQERELDLGEGGEEEQEET